MTISTKPKEPKHPEEILNEIFGDEASADNLGIDKFSDIYGNVPKPKPALLMGVLREGHKMMIAGPSKAGKSFSLIELALALVSGKTWLGIPCTNSRVLYLNAEIDKNSFHNRVQKLCEKTGTSKAACDGLYCWNLRGKEIPRKEGESDTQAIIRALKTYHCNVLILDPIYKLMTGDENSASDIREFLNRIDTIATEAGATVIYVHHYGKNTQSQYSDAMSRASGSGVFARDPDAIVTFSSLDTRNISPEMRAEAGVSSEATAYEMEFTLREFKPRHTEKVWFDDCRHILDNGILKGVRVQNNRTKNQRTDDEKKAEFIKSLQTAFTEHPELRNEKGGIRITSLVGILQSLQGEPYKSERPIRDNTNKLNGEHFRVEKGVIYPVGNENGNGNGSL